MRRPPPPRGSASPTSRPARRRWTFCLARHGTTRFTGPILAGAGRAAGLAYATLTRYFDVDATTAIRQ